MSNRQEISDEQKKQLEVNNQRFEEYAQKFKGPVLSLQTQSAQLIPNIIDQLIKTCVELHEQVDIMTSERQKVEAKLATLKAVSKTEEKPKEQPKK